MKKHTDVLNLTAWVLPDTKKQWNKQRLSHEKHFFATSTG
jgi:hypothetical protein